MFARLKCPFLQYSFMMPGSGYPKFVEGSLVHLAERVLMRATVRSQPLMHAYACVANVLSQPASGSDDIDAGAIDGVAVVCLLAAQA